MNNVIKIKDTSNDKEFKENKKNINFILKGNNKYYYANQCKRFTDLVTLFGYPYIDIEEIKKNGVSFNKYSINVGCSKDDRDLKKFSSTQELLGWVVGFCDGFAVVKRNLK